MIHALLFSCPSHYGWTQFQRIVVLTDRLFTVVSLLSGGQPTERKIVGKRNMKICRLQSYISCTANIITTELALPAARPVASTQKSEAMYIPKCNVAKQLNRK